MRQYDAVEVIANAIIESKMVESVFLKGSLARASEDEFSNIDLYCIVHDDNYELFQTKKDEFLEKYGEVVFSKTIADKYNKAIYIFNNGIVFNIITLRYGELDFEDDLAIIHDPKGLLSNYEKLPLAFKPDDIGELVDDLLLQSLEFYNSYLRNDSLYSFWLASNLFRKLGTLLRIKYDSEYAKLGLKQFELSDPDIKNKYFEIAAKLNLKTVLESVKLIHILLDNYLGNIPILFAQYINFDFYLYTKRKIMSIN